MDLYDRILLLLLAMGALSFFLWQLYTWVYLPMKRKTVTAVAALILWQGLVLSVSRKTDPNDKGLPGGKVEPGDTDAYAAMVREVEEETGLKVISAKLVFERDLNGHYVQTFRVLKWEGTIKTRETGVVEWVTPAALLDAACQFRFYNRALFDLVGVNY